MPRRRAADIGLTAIAVEGALISPEQLAVIAAASPDARTAADYGCPKGVGLRDEITRYFRIGQAHWEAFSRLNAPGGTQTAAFARGLLSQAFGFDDLAGPVVRRQGGHLYRLALEGRGGRVPIVAAAPAAEHDGFTRTLAELGDGAEGAIPRRSPASLLQDWLNASDEAQWGLVFVGDRLRLMRDNASLTRPAFIEADLGAIFRDEMFPDFTLLWLLIHATRFGPKGAAGDSPLERWREAGQRAGTAARERLRGNVEEALAVLGQGLLDANPALRERMAGDARVLGGVFTQLLRTVYRLIFLAVAEDRDLLFDPAATPAAMALYSDGYGFSALRERAGRRSAHDHHFDAFEGARIVFKALERGEPRLALPGLGGLFARGETPDLDEARIANRHFLTAVFRLSYLIDDGRRVRINWRDMATEELGSVYEGLLELTPQLADGGRVFTFAGEAKGHARKTSGSYYTPDSLVQALLKSALDPVLDRAEAEGGAEAILRLKVIDPAVGSGHFLLGAARRMADRVARLRDPDAPDYQGAMRDVVRLCIHGVDRNPMAVELAKLALWIEALDPGKPLGFLNANIRLGDSLLGVFDLAALRKGVPDAAYKPLAGDDREAAAIAMRDNRRQREQITQTDLFAGRGAADLASEASRVHAMAEESLADLNAKAQAYAALRTAAGWGARKLACDLYVAAFLRPKRLTAASADGRRAPDRVPTTRDVLAALEGRQPDPRTTALAVDIAEDARAFHWVLEFPDVMERGGFDVVLGNPPWDVLQVTEDNSSDLDDRSKAFFKDSPFDCLSRRRDLYKLFLCRLPDLMKDQGISGLLVPVGYLMEDDCTGLRLRLWENGTIERIVHFQNARKAFFVSVHSSYRFSIIKYSKFRLQQHWFSYTITDPGFVLNDDLGVLLQYDSFREYIDNGAFGELHQDLESLKTHQRVMKSSAFDPMLYFGLTAEWHATTHKSFAIRGDIDGALPVGKNRDIHQFNDEFLAASFFVSKKDAQSRSEQKKAVIDEGGSRILIRDIARNDDTVTIISCISNKKLSSYDTPAINVLGLSDRLLSVDESLLILEYLNSSFADFLIRPFVDKHIKGYVIRRIPVPKLGNVSDIENSVVLLVKRLVDIGLHMGSEVLWEKDTAKVLLIELDRLIGDLLAVDYRDREVVFRHFPHLYM